MGLNEGIHLFCLPPLSSGVWGRRSVNSGSVARWEAGNLDLQVAGDPGDLTVLVCSQLLGPHPHIAHVPPAWRQWGKDSGPTADEEVGSNCLGKSHPLVQEALVWASKCLLQALHPNSGTLEEQILGPEPGDVPFIPKKLQKCSQALQTSHELQESPRSSQGEEVLVNLSITEEDHKELLVVVRDTHLDSGLRRTASAHPCIGPTPYSSVGYPEPPAP
ncbi:hypothetical protein P7K49_038309 [Saguinus oedipus]|uniref:Uncharacterized protein n=1 Tax=Saguinus oedipus TaxID=9490 RepID=A0ABQ9TEA4_SAGOE|nr:hypothetical protein P7K49_038309 [Saguinus oedipus]